MIDARRALFFGLMCSSSALGCAGDDQPLDGGDAHSDGGVLDASSVDRDDAAESLEDAASPDAEQPYGPPPTNVSFETARDVPLGDDGVLQPVLGAAQVDYFKLEVEANTVYMIATNAGRWAPDNVLAVYDANEELLAENDIGWIWPGDSFDARLIIRPIESGTYYLKVEDLVTPAAYFAFDEAALLYYRVTVHTLDSSSASVIWESEDSSVPAQVTFTDDFASGVSHVTLIGELSEGETDTFELQGRDGQALIGHVLPGGVHGNGSTAIGGAVRVIDASDHVLAAIDRALGVEHIHPPITSGQHTLSVTAQGTLGDNSFYAINLVLLTDNPHEQAELDAANMNDAIETAELLTVQGMFMRRGTLLSELPMGDVDYYSFEANAGEMMRVICEGASAGSGVIELRAELRDPSDVELASMIEAIESGVIIEDVPVAETGTHYLRLSSDTGNDANAPPAWTRCAVTVGL